jgi:hypothetical protein
MNIPEDFREQFAPINKDIKRHWILTYASQAIAIFIVIFIAEQFGEQYIKYFGIPYSIFFCI